MSETARAAAAYESILFEAADGIAVVTLNRPQVLNGMTTGMMLEIIDALERCEADATIRAIIVTGCEGRAFCVGADLSDLGSTFENLDPEKLGESVGANMDKAFNPCVRKLRGIGKPVIMAINGIAAGGGANLALAGDIAIAAKSAFFDQAFVRIALIPDVGGTWFVPHDVGHAEALRHSLLGERVYAEEAKRLGLVWEVVEDDQVMPRARELAAKFAKGPTGAYGRIKALMNASFDNDLVAQLAAERDAQAELSRGKEFREGVAAFLEKRAPRYDEI